MLKQVLVGGTVGAGVVVGGSAIIGWASSPFWIDALAAAVSRLLPPA
jgi:hypothetical protein